MSQGNDLSPPQDALVELEGIGFDFGPALAAGELILSVSSITCVTETGYDPDAQSHIIGSPGIVASTKTSAPAAQVNTEVGGLLGGVTYILQCIVVTSNNFTKSLWTHFAGETPS